MGSPPKATVLIFNIDEHGNQTFTYEDEDSVPSSLKRGGLDNETSIDDVSEMPSLNEILKKKIKIENGDESQEMTAILVQDDDDDMEKSLDSDNGISERSGIVFQDDYNAAGETTFIETSDDDTEILMQYMDIQDPLTKLRYLLEQRLSADLSEFKFCLQDSQILESHKNLVDQCVQGEGMVQVNVQLKVEDKKINIVDVLKPAEEFVDIAPIVADNFCNQEEDSGPSGSDIANGKPTVRWIVDSNFKKEQQRLNIPQDPNDWDVAHVRHWFIWAVRQFNLTGIKLSDWHITGAQLCQISLDTYRKMVPYDPGDVFWTHLELLRKCKFAAIIQKNQIDVKEMKGSVPTKKITRAIGSVKQKGCIRMTKPKVNSKVLFVQDYRSIQTSSNRSGNNGQIQLWQFLLDLLTDKQHRNAIQWLGSDGEFKLVNPEVVAQLWGERKNKPTMNYEKLSRALRYYYEGDMISKVHGKRFVYKFDCDLKSLLGYSPSQLNSLVIEAEKKHFNSESQNFFGNSEEYIEHIQ